MEAERHTQQSTSTQYRFGDFELAVETRTLQRRGVPVHVQPKPFDVLLYLLRHRERVVSRGELLSVVWSDVVVNPEALTFALHAARKAVGDDGSRQQIIRTIPRCGFRFIAPVEAVETSDAEAAPPELSADAEHRRSRRDRPRFVGRGEIFTEIDLVLEAVTGGRGRALLFSGEPGIGKTRTVEQLAEVARDRGFRVLFGRCIEAEGSPAFWPWVQIVRSFAREEHPLPLLRTLGEGAPEIARMVPELREQIPNLPEADGVDPRAVRFLLFDSVTRFLRRAAKERPLVLILDDLHCSDQPSLLLFQFLAREIADVGVLMVGTYRPAELHADASRSEPISIVACEEGTRTLELGGFTRAEVGDLVHAVSGRVPSPNAAASLHEQTGGNPLFVNQILQIFQNEGRLDAIETADRLAVTLPRRVQDVIAHQVKALPSGCRTILQTAAVIGRDFQLSEIERATDRAGEEILELLCAAVVAGVVTEHESRAGMYCFSHILIREALYQELSLAERARRHARVGMALEQLWGEGPGPQCAALAHHFYQAAAIGEGERALEYGVRAGEWACERAAFEEAPPHFERALEVLGLIAPGNEGRRCELLLALGDAQTKAGDRETARKTLSSAARLARKVGLPDKLATAALRFAPDFLAIETGIYDPALVDLLEEALAALDPSDSAVRARLLARLAVALHWADDSEQRRRQLCDEALRMAERLGDPGGRRSRRPPRAGGRTHRAAASIAPNDLSSPPGQNLRIRHRNRNIHRPRRKTATAAMHMVCKFAACDAAADAGALRGSSEMG
jgi:DNA-binding winged helix-turn-helix (wHTH) protein